MAIEVKPTQLDFSGMHECLNGYVDEKTIPFVASVVLQGNDVVDLHFHGSADMEGTRVLNEKSIFRMHSSTKIATSIAAMMLYEEGRFSLSDPVADYIPALGDMQVLKDGAEDISETEPAMSPITIAQILSHTAGLSYGFIDPEGLIDRTYGAAGLNPMAMAPVTTLETLCEALGNLPLVYQPGTFWRYSFATDVVARLIEVISGQRFDDFLKARLLNPLGMVDTDFYVPEDKLDRLTTMYLPADPMDPMSPCVAPMDAPENSANASLPDFLSGGGGLMSTLDDYLRFTRMIIGEGRLGDVQIVKPETLSLMRTNKCAEGVHVNFPMWSMPGTGFGLGFALKETPAEGEPDTAVGEYHWGGMAGTHFWWSPKAGITGICMTQRMPGFWHPFSHDFKRMAYQVTAG